MSDYSIAMQESYKIIERMGKQYISLIPVDVIEKIDSIRNKNYKFEYDENKTLEEQNIQKETLDILSYLNLMYWCTPEEKEELLKIYKKNMQKEEEAKRIQYNPDKIFENTKTNENTSKTNENSEKTNENGTKTNETSLVVQEENQSFWKKIINKIKKFFKIK